MKLTPKLISAYLISCLFIVILDLAGSFYLFRARENLAQLEDSTRGLLLLSRMQSQLLHVLKTGFGIDPENESDRQRLQAETANLKKIFTEYLAFDLSKGGPGASADPASLQQVEAAVTLMIQNMALLTRNPDPRGFLSETLNNAMPGIAAIQTLSNHNRDLAEAAGSDTARTVGMISIGLLISLVLLLLFTTAVYVLASRHIVRPIQELEYAANDIAAGAFGRRVAAERADELGDVARGFNRMAATLGDFYENLETKVRQRTDQLLVAEKMAGVGRLAAGVAHEINNPLAAIANCAEALNNRLQQANLPPHQDLQDFPEYLQIIVDEAYRCKQITGRLLDFARQKPPVKEKVELNDAVRRVLLLLAHHEQAKNRKIHAAAAAPLWVDADAGQLQQMLLNLLLNAVQATAAGGEVNIALGESDGKAVIRVSDNGVGIPAENLQRIFDPFFTTSKTGGTGLGLAVCYQMAEQHNGSLEAESAGPGKGATFILRLPVSRHDQG